MVMVGGAVEATVVVVVVDDDADSEELLSDVFGSPAWDVGTLLVVSGFSLLSLEVTTGTVCFSSGVGLVVEVGSSGFASVLVGGSLGAAVSLTLDESVSAAAVSAGSSLL